MDVFRNGNSISWDSRLGCPLSGPVYSSLRGNGMLNDPHPLGMEIQSVGIAVSAVPCPVGSSANELLSPPVERCPQDGVGLPFELQGRLTPSPLPGMRIESVGIAVSAVPR